MIRVSLLVSRRFMRPTHKIMANFASECQLFFQFDSLIFARAADAPGRADGARERLDFRGGLQRRRAENSEFLGKVFPFSPIFSAKGGKFRRKKEPPDGD